MPRITLAVIAALATIVAHPAVSLASGGGSIADAPTLVYGQLEAGGGVQSEFWRMPVTVGDLVTFDISAETGPYVSLDFRPLPPAINDYTLKQNNGDGLGPISQGKTQVHYRSPFTGSGTLWVTDWRDAPETLGSYTFTATVTHATNLAVSAPSLVRRGSVVTVQVSVQSPAGSPEGNCLIQGAIVPLVGGKCSKRVRVGHGSKQTIKVSFVPNDGWQGAAGHRSIRLAR